MKFRKYASCVPIVTHYSTSIVKIYVYHSYGIATAHWHSGMLFIYQLINLSSKKTTENRYKNQNLIRGQTAVQN